MKTTDRILRNTKEKSYGHIQAEATGITPEALRAYLSHKLPAGLLVFITVKCPCKNFISLDIIDVMS